MAAKEVNSFFKSHKPLFKTLLTDEQFFKKENRLLKESVIICYTLLIYFATEAIISVSKNISDNCPYYSKEHIIYLFDGQEQPIPHFANMTFYIIFFCMLCRFFYSPLDKAKIKSLHIDSSNVKIALSKRISNIYIQFFEFSFE